MGISYVKYVSAIQIQGLSRCNFYLITDVASYCLSTFNSFSDQLARLILQVNKTYKCNQTLHDIEQNEEKEVEEDNELTIEGH